MKDGQELVVITKTYDFIKWSCEHTSKFPRNHRFVLGERIQGNLGDLLAAFIHAKYSRERGQPLWVAHAGGPRGPVMFASIPTCFNGE